MDVGHVVHTVENLRPRTYASMVSTGAVAAGSCDDVTVNMLSMTCRRHCVSSVCSWLRVVSHCD